MVSWSLKLNPGEILDLVVANVAALPNDTTRVDLTLALSLPGWLLLGDAKAAVAPPATAAPRKPRQPGVPAAQQTQGTATTSAKRPAGVSPRRCGWPAEDCGAYCGPMLSIELRALPASVAGMSTLPTTGGFMIQVLGAMQRQFGADGSGAGLPSAADLDGLSLRIEVPLPAYGETTSFDRAEITASGACGPNDQMPGVQTYFLPSGRVVIEAYTPLELRGRFEANLVALPLPEAAKVSLPRLPIIKAISGSFVVTRPFQGEPGFAYPRPRLDSLSADMANRMPGAPAAASPGATGPSDRGPAPIAASQAAAASSCDCSCAGYRKGLKLLEELESKGGLTCRLQVS